jgi:RimJ/RimL family protein N-acetyltransferase
LNAGPPRDADVLTTDRLVLARLRVSDARAMQAVLAEPALYRFTGGSPPSLEELEQRYRAQIAGPDAPDVSWHNWIVRLRAEGSAAGFVQATVTGDTADVAWLIGVSWQRRGIAVEAAFAVCDWLSTRGVRRLTAHIHPDHVASAKVARRLGMVATGALDSDGERIWSGQLSPPRTPG